MVKHNFKRENRNKIADKLRKGCKNITNPRDRKTVYIGNTWHTVQTKEKGEAWYDCLQCFAYHWHAGNEKKNMPIRHETINRRRIRTVIDRLMLIAGHLTVHARKIILALGRSSPWANTFIRIFKALAEL